MTSMFHPHRQPVGAIGTLILTLSLPLAAQAAPPVPSAPPTSAGQLQQELERQRTPTPEPATPAPLTSPATPGPGQGAAGPSVRLVQLEITGNRAFDSATLTRVADLTPDTDVTLADLQAAANRITAFYRNAGYLVARAYVPAQQVSQGHITIGVLEGTLDGVSVTNHSSLSDDRVTRTLTHRLASGEPLQSAPANRDILLLQQLPGAGNVRAELSPGSGVGSTRVDATVDRGSWVDGQISFDNYGNSFSGEYRGSALVHLNNLAGLGDRLTASAALAEAGRLGYGRLGWDAPVGYDGLRLGAAYSHTDYELGDAFAALDAQGTAKTTSLYASYPWVLTPDTHVNLDVSLEHRRLEDKLLGSTIDNKTVNALVLGVSGDFRDSTLGSPAVTAWRFANTTGDLDLDHTSEQWDKASGADTRGVYDKFEVSVSRTQILPLSGFSLYTAASGQWASQNLDSSEKFFLGGPDGVRAYPQGEAGGDQGWLATVALHYLVCDGLQLRLFHDDGGVRFNKDEYPGSTGDDGNYHRLSANGVGLDSQWRSFSLKVDVAWHSTGEATSDTDRDPRVWARLGWQF